MEIALVVVASSIVSSMATRWYDKYHQSKQWPKTVVFALGSWATLNAAPGSHSLHIVEAWWGDHDITAHLQRVCAGEKTFEFAVTLVMLDHLTDHEYMFKPLNTLTVLTIKYQ